MATVTPPTLASLADRVALRALFDAYAHCADRRDAAGQQALFAPDCEFAVHMDGPDTPPTYTLTGSASLAPVFADLNKYERTTHFNGQQVLELYPGGNEGKATAESYTLAHHLYQEKGVRMIMVASLRYLDTFIKVGELWYFHKRALVLDWAETRVCTS